MITPDQFQPHDLTLTPPTHRRLTRFHYRIPARPATGTLLAVGAWLLLAAGATAAIIKHVPVYGTLAAAAAICLTVIRKQTITQQAIQAAVRQAAALRAEVVIGTVDHLRTELLTNHSEGVTCLSDGQTLTQLCIEYLIDEQAIGQAALLAHQQQADAKAQRRQAEMIALQERHHIDATAQRERHHQQLRTDITNLHRELVQFRAETSRNREMTRKATAALQTATTQGAILNANVLELRAGLATDREERALDKQERDTLTTELRTHRDNLQHQADQLQRSATAITTAVEQYHTYQQQLDTICADHTALAEQIDTAIQTGRTAFRGAVAGMLRRLRTNNQTTTRRIDETEKQNRQQITAITHDITYRHAGYNERFARAAEHDHDTSKRLTTLENNPGMPREAVVELVDGRDNVLPEKIDGRYRELEKRGKDRIELVDKRIDDLAGEVTEDRQAAEERDKAIEAEVVEVKTHAQNEIRSAALQTFTEQMAASFALQPEDRYPGPRVVKPRDRDS